MATGARNTTVLARPPLTDPAVAIVVVGLRIPTNKQEWRFLFGLVMLGIFKDCNCIEVGMMEWAKDRDSDV